MMDKRNIIIPVMLPDVKIVVGTSSPINLYDYYKSNTSWYNLNKDKFDRCNSVRLYAKTSDFGILIDGNVATPDKSIVVEEGSHFIENVDIRKVSLTGVITDATVIVQIGLIG